MKNSNSKFAIATFIFSPFLTLLLVAKQYKSKLFLNVIWFYFAYLGYILVTNNQNGDSYRYSQMFEEFASLSFDRQIDYFSEDSRLDFFRPITFKIVSIFTSNPKVYFAFIAFIFGFFYSRIIGTLFQNIEQKLNWISILLIVNYLFLLNFYGFQFVRFNTATVLFIYFVLRYYLEGKKLKFLILSSLSIFIHFTFVFPVIFFIIAQFLPKYSKLYLIIFIITSFLTIVEFGTLVSFIEAYLPQELDSRKGYLDVEYKERLLLESFEANWYIKYRLSIIKYTFIFLVILINFVYKKKINFNQNYSDLILFILFFGIAANIVAIVPSGNRFLSIVYGLYWLIVINIIINNYKLFFRNIFLKNCLVLVMVFNLTIGFRYVFDTFPIEMFLGNPITIAIALTGVEMITFVKNIFL